MQDILCSIVNVDPQAHAVGKFAVGQPYRNLVLSLYLSIRGLTVDIRLKCFPSYLCIYHPFALIKFIAASLVFIKI